MWHIICSSVVRCTLQVSPVIPCTSAGRPVESKTRGVKRESKQLSYSRQHQSVQLKPFCQRFLLQRPMTFTASHPVKHVSCKFLQQEVQSSPCCRYELGRQPGNTKLSSNVTVRRVRVRGGNFKFRALRLDSGNFSWGSEVSHHLAEAYIYTATATVECDPCPSCWTDSFRC